VSLKDGDSVPEQILYPYISIDTIIVGNKSVQNVATCFYKRRLHVHSTESMIIILSYKFLALKLSIFLLETDISMQIGITSLSILATISVISLCHHTVLHNCIITSLLK